MTPRSLFNIILKIFGLFFLKETIYSVSQLFSAITYYVNFENPNGGVLTIVLTLFVLAFYIFLIIQLLFKTNNFIDKLKLDRGFDEHEFSFDRQDKFSINISSALVLRIALIVLGGVILTDEIPYFCRNIYLDVFENSSIEDSTESRASYTILSAVKIIIGLLIIGERKRIINFIEERQNKDAKTDD